MKRFLIITTSLFFLFSLNASAQFGEGFAIDNTGIVDARTGELVSDPSQFDRVMKSNREYYEEQNRQANNSQPAPAPSAAPAPAPAPAPEPAPAPAPSPQVNNDAYAQNYGTNGNPDYGQDQYAVQGQPASSSNNDMILLVGGGLLLFALFAIIILLIFMLVRKKDK